MNKHGSIGNTLTAHADVQIGLTNYCRKHYLFGVMMNNDSDFDLAMQKIWTNGALVSEKISEDVSSIIYSESDVMMLSDKATAKDSYKWETNSGQEHL